jgi:hypothetical protein
MVETIEIEGEEIDAEALLDLLDEVDPTVEEPVADRHSRIAVVGDGFGDDDLVVFKAVGSRVGEAVLRERCERVLGTGDIDTDENYVVGLSKDNVYGFAVPEDDFEEAVKLKEVIGRDTNPYRCVWNTDYDVLRDVAGNDGYGDAEDEYDGHAVVNPFETMSGEELFDLLD